MARIARLLVALGADFVAEPVERAPLGFGGFAGDRHAGVTRPSCSRTPWHPRGTPIANTRQVSIVSLEECADVAALLDVPEVDPRLLGANLVTEGVPALSALPPATRLRFPSGAVVFVTEENAPCRQPGAKLAAAHGRPGLAHRFATAAVGRRGLVGLVERPGDLAVGDSIEVRVPPPRRGGR